MKVRSSLSRSNRLVFCELRYAAECCEYMRSFVHKTTGFCDVVFVKILLRFSIAHFLDFPIVSAIDNFSISRNLEEIFFQLGSSDIPYLELLRRHRHTHFTLPIPKHKSNTKQAHFTQTM